MKPIILTISLFCYILTSKAQEALYCDGKLLAYQLEAMGAENGNYYLLCATGSDSLYLIKYGPDHSILWYQKFAPNFGVQIALHKDKAHLLIQYADSSTLYIFNSNGDIFAKRTYTDEYKSLFVKYDRIILNTVGGPYDNYPHPKILILDENTNIIGTYEDTEYNTEFTMVQVDHLQNIYLGHNVYAWEDDGIGHTLYNYKYTGLIKLSPDGNKLWLYDDLAKTVSNENSAIDFIHVDAQNDIYLYLQNYKLQLNELGVLERNSELLTGHFLAQPDYQYVPCKGVQLAFFDLVEDAFFTCRFNDDDPFELDFVNTYSLGTTTTSCTLPEHYLDPNGYITFSLRIFSPDQCSLQCFDIDGNENFFDIDPTWGPHPYSQSEDMLPQPDGNILYFYNTFEQIDDEELLILYRTERNIAYPTADLSPECP
ncbi:MAG TPA: hypothetical protein PLM90_02480, partial [Chitinophagales bacterium]|nr:hypothetical protein [Chitinophagales bacterium]